ncbi:hypothetical protein EV361DRAFT_160021 [Lentinula raphanica]|nr:hypothetical protein EV361DRAFT_160021 [Lentinula raphanica]
MSLSLLPLSQSIAQIAWPKATKLPISTCLCDQCNHLIHLDTPLNDFHEILERSRSGYNPSASECKAYLGMLDQARSELGCYQSELRRLRELTQKLEKQQRLLQAFEAGIRHILSPIQILPEEILGVIFQYACCGKDATDIANNYDPTPYGTKHRLFPTLDMSSVCIRWYRLVTSMPVLWTSFGTIGYNSKSDLMVRTFLERSRLNLVDFRISGSVTQYGRSSPSPLVAHCNRWRHVSIAGSSSFVSQSFLEPLVECKETPSNLRSLALECYSSHPIELPLIFPSLKSLVLRGLTLNFEKPQYTITTLCLSKVTCNGALSFLLHLPNVESLEVEEIEQGDGLPSSTPIVLNKMRNLTLRYPVEDAFLTSIKCPHLASLHLYNNLDFKDLQFESMISFLDKPGCPLTCLTFKKMAIDRAKLLRLFRLVPSLTYLEAEELVTRVRFADIIGGILELLAAPWCSSVDRDVDGESRDEESESEQVDEDETDEEVFPLSRQSRSHSDLQELVLPQLAELHLGLRPRNKLLLDVVRSRRPILPESNLEHSTDRACHLRAVHIHYPYSHVRSRVVFKQLEALQKKLKPFKEGGLDVEIIMPLSSRYV